VVTLSLVTGLLLHDGQWWWNLNWYQQQHFSGNTYQRSVMPVFLLGMYANICPVSGNFIKKNLELHVACGLLELEQLHFLSCYIEELVYYNSKSQPRVSILLCITVSPLCAHLRVPCLCVCSEREGWEAEGVAGRGHGFPQEGHGRQRAPPQRPQEGQHTVQGRSAQSDRLASILVRFCDM